MVDSDGNNLCFKFLIKLWNFFFEVPYMGLADKEPAGTVCHPFEAFSRGFILLELEVINFLPIIFKIVFRGANLLIL